MKKLAALSLVLAVSACTIEQVEKKPAGTKPPAGAGTTPVEDGTPAGGTTPGGGTPAGGDTVKSGAITLTQTSFKAGPTTFNSFSVSAFFAETKAGGATGATNTSCKSSTDAECTILECDTPAAPVDPPAVDPAAPVKAPHAGEITVAATDTFKLLADDKGAYTAKTGMTELFAAGADISVKAAGDTVPAFEKVFKAPAVVTLTAPVIAATGLDVDRTKALPFAWTGGGETGDVTISVSAIASPKLTSITCKYPAKDGKGTISAAAMGKLIVTDTGSIGVGSAITEAFDQGGWKLNVTATASGGGGSAKIK